MQYCGECGTKWDDEVAFCDACGSVIYSSKKSDNNQISNETINPKIDSESDKKSTTLLQIQIGLIWIGIIALGILGLMILFYIPLLGLVLLLVFGFYIWLVLGISDHNNNRRIIYLILSISSFFIEIFTLRGLELILLILNTVFTFYVLVIDQATVKLFH